MTPLVSVIIPTYERPTNLLRAIDSVRRNDYPAKEIIVVDDNGVGTHWQKETEKLLEPLVAERAIIYQTHLKNRNGSAARNTGFRLSSGKFVVFLDDDDTLSPDFISDGVRILTENKSIGAAYSKTILIEGQKERSLPSGQCPNMGESLLLAEVYCHTSTWIIRRETFESLGGFDDSYRRHQDYEFLLRLFNRFEILHTDKSFVRKYVTPNIVSGKPQKAAEYKEYFLSNFREQILGWNRGREVMGNQYLGIARKMALCGYPRGCWRYARKAAAYAKIPPAKYLKMAIQSLLALLKRK